CENSQRSCLAYAPEGYCPPGLPDQPQANDRGRPPRSWARDHRQVIGVRAISRRRRRECCKNYVQQYGDAERAKSHVSKATASPMCPVSASADLSMRTALPRACTSTSAPLVTCLGKVRVRSSSVPGSRLASGSTKTYAPRTETFFDLAFQDCCLRVWTVTGRNML